MNTGSATRASAASRFSATVEAPSSDGWMPYAATKFTIDARCRRARRKSSQLMYGSSAPSYVASQKVRRASCRVGDPVSRARAMLIAARSSGRPSRLSRRVGMTNSSIPLPVWPAMPWMTAAAPSSGWSRPSSVNSAGFRNASSSGRSSVPKPSRATVGVSMECPNR